jgi:hypothetical protein
VEILARLAAILAQLTPVLVQLARVLDELAPGQRDQLDEERALAIDLGARDATAELPELGRDLATPPGDRHLDARVPDVVAEVATIVAEVPRVAVGLAAIAAVEVARHLPALAPHLVPPARDLGAVVRQLDARLGALGRELRLDRVLHPIEPHAIARAAGPVELGEQRLEPPEVPPVVAALPLPLAKLPAVLATLVAVATRGGGARGLRQAGGEGEEEGE